MVAASTRRGWTGKKFHLPDYTYLYSPPRNKFPQTESDHFGLTAYMLPNPKETSVTNLVETHLHGLTCSICNKKIDYHYRGSDGENRSIKAPIPPDSIIWKGIYWVEGHNAEPINDGRCCDNCNNTVVLPERFWNSVDRRDEARRRKFVKDRMAHSGL